MPAFDWILSIYIALYIIPLALSRIRRDTFAFVLVVALCITFGLRAVDKLMPVQDPVIYSTLISRVMVSDVSFRDLGLDYVPLYFIQTASFGKLSIAGAFLLIHILYLVFIYPIYRLARISPGLFYILSGWMMFANSGVLLLCNFLRQGYAILVFVALLLYLPARKSILRIPGPLAVPLLHTSAWVFAPALIANRHRRYVLISAAVFVAAMLLIRNSSSLSSLDVEDVSTAGSQLAVKIVGAYVLLLVGYLIRRNAGPVGDEIRQIERATIGIVLPAAALFTLSTPSLLVHGLRFTYWIHAALFLYLALVISSNKSEAIFRLFALALCAFGIITWNHPNVAMLLVW